MKKTMYRLFTLVAIAASALFHSCETTELEILNDPDQLSEDQADPDLLLNAIQRAYVANMVTMNDQSSDLTRIDYFFGRTYRENLQSNIFNASWSRFYSSQILGGIARGISPNVNILEGLNEDPDTDLSFHLGVAKALQAHQLMLLVDFIGDIPFSEALNPLEFPSPNVDDDAMVYSTALAMLDESLGFFQASDGAGSALDFFYGGDVNNWIALVNTLKMRHALTTGDTATFNAIVSGGSFISDSSQDFQFDYGVQELNPDTRHQDYATDYTTSGANLYQSNWLMETMQGDDVMDPSDDDPRIRYYFYRQTDCTPGASCNPDGNGERLSCSLETPPAHYTAQGVSFCWLENGYWGRDHGDDDGTPPDNFFRTAVGVYPAGGLFDDDAFNELTLGAGGGGAGIEPIILASYVDFWRAEVALAAGQTGPAAAFVTAGLEKSIAKVQGFIALDGQADPSFEPTPAEVTAYIAAQAAKINDTSDDSWNALAEQYFITMYGGGSDAYNFYRRTGYPTTVKPNLNPNPGPFPRTYFYPNVEVVANPNIQQRADLTTQVFWDTNPASPAFPPAN